MNSLCCRAGPCDQAANCIARGGCQYKSSSEKRAEKLRLEKLCPDRVHGARHRPMELQWVCEMCGHREPYEQAKG